MNNVLDEIRILINNGIYDKALDRLLKIHNINNTDVDINFELAKVYFALKDDGKGLNVLKNIINLKCYRADVFQMFFKFYKGEMNHDIEKIINIVNEHFSDASDVYVEIAKCYVNVNSEKAIKYLQKSVDNGCKDEYVFVLLSKLYRQANNIEKAKNIINSIHGRNTDYLCEKIQTLLFAEEYEKLIIDIKKCIVGLRLVNSNSNTDKKISEILDGILRYKIFAEKKSRYVDEFICLIESNLRFLSFGNRINLIKELVKYFHKNDNFEKTFKYLKILTDTKNKKIIDNEQFQILRILSEKILLIPEYKTRYIKYKNSFMRLAEKSIKYLKKRYKKELASVLIKYFYENDNFDKTFEYLAISININCRTLTDEYLKKSKILLQNNFSDFKNKSKAIKNLKFCVKKCNNIKLKNFLLNKLELMQGRIRLKSRPSILHVCLTNRCNLRCIMCLDNEHTATYDIDKKKIDFVKENMPYLEYISWLGGEVFISKVFNELSELAVKHNVRQRIITNGLLLDEKKIKFIMKNNMDLKISIDAVNKDLYETIRVGGSFNKLVQILEKIKKYKDKNKDFKYGMAATITTLNFNSIEKMTEFAFHYGFTSIDLRQCLPTPWNKHIIINEEQEKEVVNKIKYLKSEIENKKINIEINTDFDISGNISGKDEPINHNFKQSIEKDIKKEKIFCVAPWKLLCIERDSMSFSAFCDRIEYTKGGLWNSRAIVELRKKILNDNLPDCCNVTCRNAQDFGEKIRIGMI